MLNIYYKLLFSVLGRAGSALGIYRAGAFRAGATFAKQENKIEIFILLFVVLSTYAMTASLVSRYYAVNIPHYDSVGTLSFGFQVINGYAAGGYESALEIVTTNKAFTALSFTQAYFAVIFSPVLSKSPESFQLYNSATAGIGMMGLFLFARGAGVRFGGAVMAAVLFLIPDGQWRWAFGLVDYRRDAGMLGLLTGSFFCLLALYTGRWTTQQRTGLALLCGTITGLALISRDSAPIYVAGIIGVPALMFFALDALKNGFKVAVAFVLPAALTSMPFAIFFALHIDTISARLMDPLVAYGSGMRILDSLWQNIRIIGYLLWGPIYTAETLQSIFLALAALFAWLALLARMATWRRTFTKSAVFTECRSNRPASSAFAAGLWVVTWVHCFLSLFVGWRASLPFTELAPPYLPSLIGVWAIVLAVSLRLQLRASRPVRIGLMTGVVVAAFAAAAVRLEWRITETPTWMREANEQVARLSGTSGSGPTFAELTFETIRIPMIAYRAYQLGNVPPRRIRFRGGRYDTAIGIPSDQAELETLLRELGRAIRCEADYVVVETDLASYERASSPLLIYRHGLALVSSLIEALPIAAGPFAGDGATPVVVLDNRSRPTCPLS